MKEKLQQRKEQNKLRAQQKKWGTRTALDRLHNVCGEYKMVPATADGYKIMLLSNSFPLSLTNQIFPHASLHTTLIMHKPIAFQ
jgi:hypothetical protein